MKFVVWVITMTIAFSGGLFLIGAILGVADQPNPAMAAGALGGFIASISTMPNRKQEGK
jgi:hypothetical protein